MRITVRGQNLIPEDGPGCGRPGEIEFSFSRDWDRFLKFAQFTQHGRTFNTMLAENRCRLPPEIREGPYYLNVTGITPDTLLGHHGVGIFWNIADWDIES